MKLMASIRLLLLIFLTSLFLFHAVPVFSTEQAPPNNDVNLDTIAPDQVDSVLAKLTDEQVRSLLITELSKDVSSTTERKSPDGGLFGIVIKWLHFFDIENEQEVESRVQRIMDHTGEVPEDLGKVFLQFGDGSTLGSAWKNVFLVLLILLAAFGIELLFKTLSASFRRQFLSQGIPELGGYMRLWAGIMHEFPAVVHLAVFGAASLLLFVPTPLCNVLSLRYLFMAILFSIFFIRLGVLLSHLICSPRLDTLRLLPVTDSAARKFHSIMLFFVSYVGISMSFVGLVAELGIPEEAIVLIVICLGSTLILLTAILILQNRQSIADYILSSETVDSGSSWVMNQFASLWHVPALLYLFIVWMIFLFQQTLGIRQDKGALLLSLLIVPMFLLFDRIGQWVTHMTVTTLKIYQVNEDEDTEEELDPDELTPEQKERVLIVKVGRIVRLAILVALTIWILNLWGYHLPYMINITKIVFRSLVTMALALFFWKIVSDYVERKIREEEPEEEEEEEEGEWGSAVQRGRSYTLLPMVRKFIGTVLFVLVTLIVLSTIGIEIGPLLAGAGVVGLAIGFGAQKLVSDVFSGFFYLLDDAFRVGEYLEAGGVSGAVEDITLRNVMLRHHRGMLQIVPYSELGPITNYMRGGIVVKFNLEFPYDTDIDQVRKVIKKVGQAMLADEEFAEDFIKPVKSQGVREITGSVMVIRVKFTAKPGTHFVIRREAYRKITEALAAKGIHYAHRKVIVELPKDESTDANQQEKIAEAGAAAGLAALSEEEQKKQGGGGTPPTGMPGM